MKRILTIATACALLAACAHKPVPDRVALPEAPPPGEPPGLVGISAGALMVALGSPSFTRHDGDTEMWRYDGPACKAWFFLYPDKSVMTVRHVETSPRPSIASFDAACLTQLRHAPQPSS